ncbi:MAG: serine/threonine protein kinase [Candidatus Promineifilaceae bacterium]
MRDRYRLKEVVGHGGMGNVYLAEDLRLPGRLCAIKEVQPEANASPEARRQEHNQFLREASLLAQLDHPNLPKVSDFFAEGGRDYLVMDYVPGKNLKELIDDSRIQGRYLDVSMVNGWAQQIMDAVDYLHRQEPAVLHRDIKPSNIKLTPDGRIKLVDFGLAKVMATDNSSTITVIQGRGTAYYTPLEQYGAESEHTNAKSDIYALGATLYHLLSGSPPPEAKERFLNPSVMRSLRSVNGAVPARMSDAVDWGLEMHPDNRPESVETFRKAFNGEVKRGQTSLQPEADPGLIEALNQNSAIVALVVVLFALAVVLTLL